MAGKLLRALFVAYLAATAVHVAWVAAHEPFTFDAWNIAADTGAKPITAERFAHYWWFEYTHSNPRIGQAFAYLGYKLEGFTDVMSPLALLAIGLAIATLGLGRLPRWRRGRDLAWWAFATGALWFALPEIGKTLFCRAYASNYVYGLAIQLWFLVPLRLASRERAPSRAACIAYAAFGGIAGLCNEHTGPTLCAFALGLAWWPLRPRPASAPLARWGGAGAAVGFLALFFAPGQGQRYDGLAQRMSLIGRVVQHGVAGNFDILRELLIGLAPVLAIAAFAGGLALVDRDAAPAQRDARIAAVRGFGGVLLAALAMAVTMFVSPKLGSRFYLASCSLALAAAIALADLVVSDRALRWLVALAAASSIYAAARTVPLYGRAALASDARLAALAAAPPNGIFIADGFEQVDESWWFYGDDFRDEKKREMVANYFGLGAVEFHAYDPLAPLGVTGARFVPVATLDPPGCLADAPFSIFAVKGFDLAGLHAQLKAAIELLRERVAPQQIAALSVEVQLDDPRIHLPAKHVVAAKWWPDRFEAYVGSIERPTHATTRTITVPKDLPADAEIYVYRVGGDSRRIGSAREPLHYVPWAGGVYWVLACRGDECFVIAATRQGG